jgi:glycosyltransferase involved in cell wall biosynthesis
MRVSLIVAVYKDVEALSLIIDALKMQTYKNFEVVVVEDGESDEMQNYVSFIKGLDVKHTRQEDIGVRKARSQNNGVIASCGEYLIFIDGDCIPYSTFIEGHVKLAQKGCVLTGRRLNLPQNLSSQIRAKTLSVYEIEKNLWRYSFLLFDKEARFRQGIYLNPDKFFYKLFSKKARATAVLGCNFSCFREDMVAINGFDESYGESAVSDDMDLDWRFRAYGLELRSCKNVANVAHLWHKAHDRGDPSAQVALMREREKERKFRCEKGLNTH